MTRTVLITGATSGFGARRCPPLRPGGLEGDRHRPPRRTPAAAGRALRQGRGARRRLRHPRSRWRWKRRLLALPPAFGEIDLLVNNAGLAQGTAPAQSAAVGLDHDDRHQHHRAGDPDPPLLPQLVERKGAIINISSVAGVYPYPGGNAYGGTKAFVSQFSLGLRSDLHGTGVRVTTIEPGMAETEFTVVRTHGDQNASDKLYSGANPMTAEDIAEQIFWVATLPPHLNINRLELMPVSQSFAGFQVAREG
jgi:serine 3-dehydrogenase